jgi:ABC-type Fe3+-hydroxamate transport system substrate-binding protein
MTKVLGMTRRLTHEFIWIGPFVLLCLMAVTLFRSWTTVPPAAKGRVILDGSGKETIIPEPFPGVITGVYTGDFLTKTHAPEAVLKIDGPRARPRSDRKLDLMWRIYARLVRNAALWDFPSDTETVLAKDAGGVYLFGGAYFKEFGLTTVNFHPTSHYDVDEVMFTITRVLNRMLGREERAEPMIDRYQREIANLAAELRLEAIPEKDRPRALGLVFDGWDRVYGRGEFDPMLGFRDPSVPFMALGRDSDAERILAMNPDLIVLFVGASEDFLRDPRWRGIEATQSRQVYTNITALNGYTYDMDGRPLAFRWEAELAYPDRLPPTLRDRVREHYQESYGYRLSEEEIDELLQVEINRGMTRYERFMNTTSEKISETAP